MVNFICTYYLLARDAENKEGRKASGWQLLVIALIRAIFFVSFFIGLVLFVGYHLIFIDHSFEGNDDEY